VPTQTDQSLPLTPTQINEIVALGSAGLYAKMYGYIVDQMLSKQITGYSDEQLYWFKEAMLINEDDESAPATFFIRDMTRIGMGLSSNSDPQIQAVSNQIGLNVFQQIQAGNSIPPFSQQLNIDINAALNDAGLSIGEWGGSFYFWNTPFTDPDTHAATTIGAYILSNSTQKQLFITNVAQATVDTAQQFGTALLTDSAARDAFLTGFENLTGDHSVQSYLLCAEIWAQVNRDVVQAQSQEVQQLWQELEQQIGVSVSFLQGGVDSTAGNGPQFLLGGQVLGEVGNDTLSGGSGSDTFVFSLPTNGSAIETVKDPFGNGQVDVASDESGVATLGGSSTQRLVAVEGESGTWQDSQGAQYQYNSDTQELSVTGGVLGAGNQIVIDDFNLAAAAGSNGYLGIYLANAISVVAGSDEGVDPPAPAFTAGCSQSYTVSVLALSSVAQTVTMTLSGAPAADFGIGTADGVDALNADGTFSVTIPAGATSVSFTLINTNDVGANATLQLTASLSETSDPAGGGILSDPLTFSYAEPTENPFTQPASGSLYYYGPNSAANPTYYSYGNNSQQGSLVGGVSSGNDLISVVGAANDSIAGAGNDTIFANFGGGIASGGTDVITGNGGQDILWVSHDFVSPGGTGPASVRVYGNSAVDLTAAIAGANSDDATGAQGDLIVSEVGNATLVGSNGNDLFIDGGNDVVVAGPGDDTIVGGAYASNFVQPPPGQALNVDGVYAGLTWSASFGDEQLSLGGSLGYVGVPNATPPAGYEGNYDSFGSPLAVTNSTIFGGSGDDVIELSNGNNEVELGTGDSTVLGGMGSDTIIGGDGDNSILGGGGNDYITAGDGASWLAGQAGNNTIIGGAGADTLFAGGDNSNWQTEETGNNYVQAGSGNTLIDGSGGNDTLLGGSGNDTIQAGAGNEYIVGGSGNESIDGGAGNDTLDAGGSGNDTIWATTGNATIYGGDGTDLLNGGSGSTVIYAGDGGTGDAPTTVWAGSGETTIYGGDGVDYLNGGAGDDVIYAGDGGTADAPTRVWVGSGDTTVYGGDGFDVISGGSGTNVLYAGDGGTDDSPTEIVAGSGTATLYGGAGASTLEDTLGGNDVLQAGDGDSTLTGIGNDTLTAGGGIDLLVGAGNNTYVIDSSIGGAQIDNTGGAGTLEFTSDVDPADMTVSAGLYTDGTTVLVLEDDGASVSVDGGLGASGVASVVFDDPSSISLDGLVQQAAAAGNAFDTVIAGASGNLFFDTGNGDSVTGDTGNDTISAWGDNDTITAGSGGGSIYAQGSNTLVNGGTGNDSLSALGTDDTLIGGTGNETFYVTDVSDVVEGQAGAASNSLYSTVSYTLPTNVDALTLQGSTNLTATGNSDAANLITGNSGNDSLIAGSGADTLVSGSGIDTLVGGSGPDTFFVNNAADEIDLPYGGNRDTITASVSYTLTAGVGSLTLAGSSDLVATDDYGYAQITGNAGNDTLIGGSGADTLVAGAGVDTLVSGIGRNTLIINSVADVIEASVGASDDTVESSVSYTLGTGLDTLLLTGGSNVVGQGNNDAANSITGNSGNDVLIAGSGADTLVSGSGIDTLVAGAGNDLLVGNNAGDTYVLNSGFGTTQINLSSGGGTVQFGAGISAVDLSVSTVVDAQGNFALQISDGSSVATVDDGTNGGLGSFNFPSDELNFDFANGTQLSFAQLLATADVGDSTLAGGDGNLVLNSDTGASLSGGTGNDTIIGVGAGDTIVAGNGNQALYGSAGGDELAAGMGADTLYGAGGNDTLAAGSGSTIIYGGGGSNSYLLSQNGIATIYASGAPGVQTLVLPDGMTAADFTALAAPDGDLVLQSISGDTTAIIKGFYSNPGSGVWLLADSSGDAQLLQQWASTVEQVTPGGGATGSGYDPGVAYTQEITALRQDYSDTIDATLDTLGSRDESFVAPGTPRDSNSYDFTGVATQNITVQGGSLNIASSDDDDTQTIVTQVGTRTETYTVATYGVVSNPAISTYIPGNNIGVQNFGNAAAGLIPVTDSNGNVTGFDYVAPASSSVEQTGSRTETVTYPVLNAYTTETQGFNLYNITGDGGTDVITATAPFIGTVDTGNGNVLVDLGIDESEFLGGAFSDLGHYTSPEPLPIGSFIQAGNGNDDILGTGGADTIAAGLGTDTILTSLGSTVYVPMDNGSTDYINVINAPYYGSGPYPQSTLVLPEGVTPGDLQYRLLDDPSDTDDGSNSRILELTYGASSVFLTYDSGPPSWYLQGADSDDTDGITQVQFADGTVLTRSQLIAMAGAGTGSGPGVTFLETTLSNNEVVAASSLFTGSDSGAGIELYQISNSASSGAYFTLNDVTYAPGATVNITAAQLSQLQYNTGPGGESDTLQVEAFDGSAWSTPSQQFLPITASGAGNQAFQATGADQYVVGSTTGPDTLTGGYGGDTLFGASAEDTFDYAAGSGAETIVEAPASGAVNDNTLQFGAGIAPESITATLPNGSNLVLNIGTSGDSVDLTGFDPANPLGSTPVQQFQFADGTTLSLVQLLNQVQFSSEAVTNADGSMIDYVIGSNGQTIYSASMYNATGQNTLTYNIDPDGTTDVTTYTNNADGSYTYREVVTPPDGGAPTISVGGSNADGSVSTYDTTYPDGSTDNTTDIYNDDGSSSSTEIVTPADGSGATTTVTDYNPAGQTTSMDVTNPDGSTADSTYAYNADGSYTDTVVSTPAGGGAPTTVVYDYDSSGNLTGESGGSSTFQATGADQTLTGSASGPDTLTGGYAGDTLVGASGEDTFVYNSGSGAETLSETAPVNSSSANVLQFGTGITPASISLTVAAGDELVVAIGSSGDSVTIDGFNPVDPLDSIPIQQFQFADGTTLSFEQLLSQVQPSSTVGSVANADGTTTYYEVNMPGNSLYTAETESALGDLQDFTLNADGSSEADTFVYNADGSVAQTEIATPAGGGAATTYLTDYNAQGQETSSSSTNPDGSTEQVTYDSQGRTVTDDYTAADGSIQDATNSYNADGSYTETQVDTPASGGAASTYVFDYNAQGQETSQTATYPGGSTEQVTYDSQGRVATDDVTAADGSTQDSINSYNADGSYTETQVQTPAGGGAVTTYVIDYNAQGQETSSLGTYPDGSTEAVTYDSQGRTVTDDLTAADGSSNDATNSYNADGSYIQTTVSTPAGGASTTAVTDYDSNGNQLSENVYTPSSDGSYTDSWQNQDGSYGGYWWNAATQQYQETWQDSNGASWTDDYQYATGGSPGSTGVSFTETYTDSAGDQGTRQYNAATGVTSLTWDSSATGMLTGTTADSGFIGLQNNGELTNTQPDPSFFNPTISPAFQSFLAGH
jgi:YD repeat-containing protein